MSIPIARIARIPVRLHASFLLLPLIVVVASGGDAGGPWSGLWLIVAVFTCVALHELGHAMIAARFGIRTLDITLYPTGGIARLEHPPAVGPELWIALAGPAVNAIIAAGLAGFVLAAGHGGLGTPWSPSAGGSLGFWSTLLWVNVSLLVFNLVPAYPMDGGRIFRALVARRLGASRATVLAVRVGQVLAAIAVGAGMVQRSPWLVVLGVVVLLGATQQALAEQAPPSARARWAREAMRTDFTSLSPDDTLERASSWLLDGSGADFPVVDRTGRLLGLLPKPEVLHRLAVDGPDGTVESAMVVDVPTIGPDDDLRQIAARVAQRPGLSLLVVQDGAVVGVIPAERVAEVEFLERLDLDHAPDETVGDSLR